MNSRPVPFPNDRKANGLPDYPGFLFGISTGTMDRIFFRIGSAKHE